MHTVVTVYSSGRAQLSLVLTTTYALFNMWNLSSAESTLGQQLLSESLCKVKCIYCQKLGFSSKFLSILQSHRLFSSSVIRHQGKACHLN